ncbi:MAG TPA: DUF5131 family protein [Verrucomicrobiae bacterium]|nr:DUF5131 family protein [Verrucomicrobiae bacterium]
MSDETKIQWCDSTVNPVMGCGGCPLWPTPAALRKAPAAELAQHGVPAQEAQRLLDGALDGLTATDVYQRRRAIAAKLERQAGPGARNGRRMRGALQACIERPFSCYAGKLHCNKGLNGEKPDKKISKGYAPTFERVTCFPGRMAEMARKADLAGKPRPDRRVTRKGKSRTVPGKPWLDGMPRLVFVSDMGDALSRGVGFGFLKDEIIGAVSSQEGARHIWLWVTKRPARMAEFARWLREEHGIPWPDNLVAMTSVIDQRMARAVDDLRKVPARLRGLSVEPLLERVQIDLTGIGWAIVGGESGPHGRPFDLAWPRDLRDECRQRGIACFVKQLGRRPVENGQALKLRDPHGGDWSEWPGDLRVREMPGAFRTLARKTAAIIR